MIKLSDKARQVLDSMSVKKREYEEKKAKKFRFRPGTVALREIKRYQKEIR